MTTAEQAAFGGEEMNFRSTGLVHTVTSDIKALQRNLRESYGSGFTIFKELLQNADDAGATTLTLVAHDGFSEATNPLLRAPGLVVANNGVVLAKHMDGITLASGGSKADERVAVGRFGLGQKSVYHLCDAFFALGWVRDKEDKPSLLLMNPWAGMPEAQIASIEWQALTLQDKEVLLKAAKVIVGSQGMVLFLPLRTTKLRPGQMACLSESNWDPDTAIDDILAGQELSVTLCCLRRLETVRIVRRNGVEREIKLSKGARRLAGPDSTAHETMISGTVAGVGREVSFSGRQQWARQGTAEGLLKQPGWTPDYTLDHKPIPPKADPHGAVIVCRKEAENAPARLSIRNAVYLPLGAPLECLDLDAGNQDIELVLHGYFFVSSDRKTLRQDDHIEAHWNDALRREATLPLVLDALADALPALNGDQERYAVVRALSSPRHQWWMKNGADACRGRALARCSTGEGTPEWLVVQADALRPVPVGMATTLPRLREAIPDLEAWSVTRRLLLCFGTVLSEAPPFWPDGELAELLGKVGPAAFTRGSVAATMGALLEGQAGPLTREALADQFRLACADPDSSFAPTDRLKTIVRHLPPEQLLILPPSVENRSVMAALAAVALPVKSIWLDASAAQQPTISLSNAVALLSALEPLLLQGGQASLQAATMVLHVLRHGPRIDELARNETGRYLKVIPARQMQSAAAERLSLETVITLQSNGLLFDPAPNKELDLLAQAVAAPAIYKLDLRDGGIEGCASAKRKESLVAVLKRAQSFGDAGKCGELAELLREHASVDDLRRLITQDAELDGDVELVELTGFGDALDGLVDRLCPNRNVRLISSATAEELHKVRAKIGLKPLDVALLGKWLNDARCEGTLPDIDAATAQALLASNIDDVVLRHLPLNGCVGDDALYPATALFLGQRSQVPANLAGFAKLADLWPDQAASARQNRLIEKWGPEAIIRTALAAPQPEIFTVEICDALRGPGAVTADLIELLAETAWIGVQGKAWKPLQVLDLPLDAEQAWVGLASTCDGFLRSSQLPACLRDDDVRARLVNILPAKYASYLMALKTLGDAGTAGLCLDAASYLSDLRRIAQTGAMLGANAQNGGAWPLLASALKEDFSDPDMIALAGVLPPPARATIVAQMNTLAELAEERAHEQVARRLHHATFQANVAYLGDNAGHLPADLLVLNAADRFVRSDAVAYDAAGLASAALLDRRYAACLTTQEDVVVLSAVAETKMPLTAALERTFGPLVKHDLGDGILLALAMTGRGSETRTLASQWQGQHSFDRIIYDLDQVPASLELDPLTIPKRLEELRFEVSFPEGGTASVYSLAGTAFKAPLSGRGEALLIQCRQRERTWQDIEARVVCWELVLGDVEPASADDAKALLRQFMFALAPALLLSMPSQRQALLEQLDSYFASNQRSLDDARRELRDVLYDRLEGIRAGKVIREAVADFHRIKYGDLEGARDALWDAAQSPQGAAELLDAMRVKIAEMGYRPDRVLFELYQNAVDAQAQWHGSGKVQIETRRDDDGTINLIRLIHWGRPINQPGPDRTKADNEGHERDLSNMLAVSHSAKEGDAITGRFGLGFKTVHMLSDSVGLASAGVILRIAGGMVPVAWDDGEAEARPYNDRGRKATLIDIPIADDRRAEATAAWEAFCAAAPVLAALGRDGEISLVNGTEPPATFGNDVRPVIDGVAIVSLDRGRQALRFDVGERFRLFVALGRNGPHAFPKEVAQFWHLVPLMGISRNGAWLMEGPFSVDPGRSHFSGSAEENEALFARLGQRLAERLVALHEASETKWCDLARQLNASPDGKDAFWQALIAQFVPDLDSGAPQRKLHRHGGGIAQLLGQCALVPLAFEGNSCAADVAWRLEGALADPSVYRLLQSWSALDPFRQSLIGKDTADLLSRLGLPRGKALDLPTLVELATGDSGIDADLAGRLSLVIDEALRAATSKEEDEALRRVLRERKWRAEDGSWQPIRVLAFPQSDDPDERARAGFAPPAGRLAADYCDAALELAQFADQRSGGHLDVLQEWARTANSSDARRLSFLRYLATRTRPETVPVLAKAADWLPPEAELQASPLLDGLEQTDRNLLLLKLGCALFSERTPEPTDDFRPDAETVLLAIAEWWQAERETLIPAYERSVYPTEGFAFGSLNDDSDETWFTLLALATFQTLGRIKPDQSRHFVTHAMNEGWWHQLSTINPDADNLDPFVERLRAWSEPDAREDYMIWRRCLTDLCLIARHLDDYRTLFRRLPGIIRQDGPVSIGNLLRPAFSVAASRIGVFAPPLARSLGIGANWIVRELARKGVYSQAQADLVLPYGWSTADRVRKLAQRIGLGTFEHGVDAGRNLHKAVENLIGEDAAFAGDGDLPLHIITLAKHRDILNAILYDADGDGWTVDDLDEDRSDDA